MKDPARPFTAIIGGSKVSSKIDIINNMLDKVNNIIIGGGMAFTFIKAEGGKIGNSLCEDDKLDLAKELMAKAKGGKIGNSLCEDDKLDLAKELMAKAKANNVNLVLASDAKLGDSFSNDANTQFSDAGNIPDGWSGFDIGPKGEKEFADVIKASKTILWNGPVGVFEFENFSHGTKAVAEAIVDATKHGAFSLIGGGDSVAAINKFGFANDVSYVSTGGGALLEFIEGKVLPGIKAIRGY